MSKIPEIKEYGMVNSSTIFIDEYQTLVGYKLVTFYNNMTVLYCLAKDFNSLVWHSDLKAKNISRTQWQSPNSETFLAQIFSY